MISVWLPGRRYGRATPFLRNAQATTEDPSTGRGSTYRNRNGVSTTPVTSLNSRKTSGNTYGRTTWRTVFETYEPIVDACCHAWNSLAA
jgi:hypothetical protein